MKNALIVCAIFCSLHSLAQTGLYTMKDKSKLIITPSYAPDFRYRKIDGASGRLYLQADSTYISAPGWANKESPNIFVKFTKDEISSGGKQAGIDPMPALRKVKDPMPWVIAGKDTEAPNEETSFTNKLIRR